MEYNEKNHDRFKDADKKLSSEQSCDKFIVYDEKTDNKEDFYKNTIYSLILFICATTNEIGKLGNILNYKNNLKNNEFFNEIIAYKQNKTFNIEKFFNDFWLSNMNTYEINTDELYTVEDFIAFIETDEWGHENKYQNYINSIKCYDKYIKYKTKYLELIFTISSKSGLILNVLCCILSMHFSIKSLSIFFSENANTLEHPCLTAISAVHSSEIRDERIPFCLLAAIFTPCPLLQNTNPKSQYLSWMN